MELACVLKPEAQLYVNTNGLGWYMNLWVNEPNKTIDYDPKIIAASCLNETLIYNRTGAFKAGFNLIIEPQELKNELEKIGFINIKISHEGGLHLNSKSQTPQPFFEKKYFGQTGVYEAVAVKQFATK